MDEEEGVFDEGEVESGTAMVSLFFDVFCFGVDL